MRNLIKADMQRILRKKSIWVALILMIAIVIGDIFYTINTSADKNLAFAVGASESFYFLGLVVGIILVLNVYADDIKSTSYINVVGQGISRVKYILTKYLDAMILLVAMYVLACVLIFGLKAGLGVQLSSLETRFIWCNLLCEIIPVAASISIASLIYFQTGNNALGMLVYLGIELVIPVAIEFIKTNPTVVKYHLDRIYLTDVCSSILDDLVMRQTGAGLLKLILVIAVYVVAAIVGSIVLFRKKELDF